MTCPSSCHDPNCTLTYRDHLLGIGISPAATPTRSVTRTEGLRDEPTTQTRARENRWKRDLPAFKRLTENGVRPKSTVGAAALEQRLGG